MRIDPMKTQTEKPEATAHTPTPWTAEKDLVLFKDIVIIDCSTWNHNDANAEANAALIVKAVNEYEAHNAIAEAAKHYYQDPTGQNLTALRKSLSSLSAIREENKP